MSLLTCLILQIFNTIEPLTREKIDEIRAEWASIFLEDHIPPGDED